VSRLLGADAGEQLTVLVQALGDPAHRLRAVLLRALEKEGALRPGVTVEEANDILWVITSFESFDLLYDGRGLPLDTVVERLTAIAERAVMA